uniref:Uncharacterized protein n=1 Tax=Panagrolaimus sp. ES5 TaxID=591445 RepID=A0AC34GAM6_9BILA
MPDEIVWVDKVLNPRSAVLTHNEAMKVLQNAKGWLSRPRLKATINKAHGMEKKLSVVEQKAEYIKLQKMFLQQDEMKPILEMQAELEAIETSKKVLKKAIEQRSIFPDGLPRLKPSLFLKKELARGKKIKGNEVAEKLSLIDKSAINKNALKRILIDANDDDTKDETPMEVDAPLIEPKIEVDDEKIATKRRRVIISDDETDDEDVSKDSKVSIALLPKDPSESALEYANDRLEFKHAFSKCGESTFGAPFTVCFEASKDVTKVLALTEEDSQEIEDNETPTNLMFTNYAIAGVLKSSADEERKPEEALRSFWLGDCAEKIGSTALTDSIKIPSNLGKSEKTNYAELVKDENFCSKLLNSCEADWDVSQYFEMDGNYRPKENEYLPKLQTLNSLFGAFDLDLLQYQANVAEFNAARV